WNLPGPARPGYVQRLGRAMLFIALLGGGVIVTTGLASLSTYVLKGFWAVILAGVLTAAFNVGMYVGAFRALTPKGVPTRRPLTEADRASMALQALQNQRRPEQHVEVTFDDRPPETDASARTPQIPDEVAPPAQAPVPEQRPSTDEGAAARPGIQ